MQTKHLHRIYKKVGPFLSDPADPILVVSIEEQALFVCENGRVIERYDASTSRFGTGNRENSLKTPLGKRLLAKSNGRMAPVPGGRGSIGRVGRRIRRRFFRGLIFW